MQKVTRRKRLRLRLRKRCLSLLLYLRICINLPHICGLLLFNRLDWTHKDVKKTLICIRYLLFILDKQSICNKLLFRSIKRMHICIRRCAYGAYIYSNQSDGFTCEAHCLTYASSRKINNAKWRIWVLFCCICEIFSPIYPLRRCITLVTGCIFTTMGV